MFKYSHSNPLLSNSVHYKGRLGEEREYAYSEPTFLSLECGQGKRLHAVSDSQMVSYERLCVVQEGWVISQFNM